MPIVSPRQLRASRTLASRLLIVLTAFLFAGSDLGGQSLAEAPPADQPASQDPPKAKRDGNPALEKARAFLESGQIDAATGVLKNFISSDTGPAGLDEAYLLLAGALIEKHQYAEAGTYLDRLLSEFPKSDLADRARLMLGTAQAESGNLDQALPVLAEARSLSQSLDIKLAALKLTGEIYARKKDFPRAIQAWREEMTLAPEEQRSAIRQQIRRLVMEKMDRAALSRLHEASPTDFPGDIALIRLIEFHAAAGDDHLTERALRQFLQRFPEHEHAAAAKEQLGALKTKLKASKFVIAALLPLSGGRLGTFGAESLNGIRLALERSKETSNLPPIGLLIKDSEAGKPTLKADLADLMSEYRPVAVIGPLLTRDLQAVAGLAAQSETPFITPSATLTDVHRLGSFLFSTALTAPPQARRLAEYATKQAGYRRFCILHPETAYGQELARLFGQEIRQRGGEIVAVESYKDGDTDFGGPIKRLKVADLMRYGKSTNVPTSKGAIRIEYAPGFDAIFLPSPAGEVSLIAAQLLFYDVKVSFLGSNAWNSPDLLRLAGRALEGAVYTDGFFPDSPNSEVREFVDLYRQRYQADPSLFSAQAYDATRIVLEAVKKGATSGKAVRDLLEKVQDLPTLTGAASFGPQGTLDRRIALIQVKQGKLVLLEE
jgi:ABC-type branched-subunit amino acid transport system substrate-binding protein/predicted negative regulator of RcsB-dependent stress response